MSEVTPLVTVITPAYNARHLSEAMASVAMQDYSRIQYIVSDDGTEGFDTAAVRAEIASLSHSFEDVRVIHHPKNIGTVANLNSAFAEATGEIVFLLACDDVFYSPSVISEWVRFFEETGADVSTSYRLISDDSLKKEICIAPNPTQVENIKNMSPAELYEDLIRANYIMGCCTAFRMSAFRKVGGYEPCYDLIDDYPIMLKFSRMGYKTEFFSRVTVKYRNNGVSAASNLSERYVKDCMQIIESEFRPYAKDPKAAEAAMYAWIVRHENFGKFEKLLYDKKALKAAFKYPKYFIKENIKKIVRGREISRFKKDGLLK